ncbi:CaiB/BaiF CoA transferase family protein [Nocardia salmonicida]|uniref:CaiB/BaiF CoA transferase family protein n=1 Tax=Nocardia salmonicida TaxID=53431 RepID=UPI0033D6159C
MTTTLPLEGLRVVDMSDGKGEMCGRFFADLGAEVILVEPPLGMSSRRTAPMHEGISSYFASHNANKSSVVLDITAPEGRRDLLRLLSTADIWIETTTPGSLAVHGLGPTEVRRLLPHLVIMSMTDFGQSGPRSHQVATDWVQMSVAGILSRSGAPDRAPLLPPGALAIESAAVQASWAALVAYWNGLESGEGDYLDFSIYDSVSQILDPPLGTIGTAAAAMGDGETSQDRSAFQPYPIFRCADGHVRIVVLAARQWRALRAWLGEPEALQSPELELAHHRYAQPELINPYIAALFENRNALDLVSEGQRRGVPIAPVLTPAQVLESEHFKHRGALIDLEIAPGVTGRLPSGHVEVNGSRAGIRHRAPTLGENQAILDTLPDWSPTEARTATPAGGRRHALRGLRVLDLGVIVMGAEAGRLFADQGADVIKVENRAYPDGSRATMRRPMNRRFAAAQRGKRGFGVDLRTDGGRKLFRSLVEQSDVVLSNFKPGTLEKLGIGIAALREINPAAIIATSSAMGATGPWSDWMGYGPLVRCVTGLTSLWRYPDDDSVFGDSSTVYPDHLEARIVDVAVLACLIARRRSGLGAHVEASQAEAILTALSSVYLDESFEPGSAGPHNNTSMTRAPSGVYPCSGDDAWCVIDVRDEQDWTRLVEVIQGSAYVADETTASVAQRIAHRDAIDKVIADWTRDREASEVERVLQDVGVPAGAMRHVVNFVDDEHLKARGCIQVSRHPLVRRPIHMENALCVSSHLADPEISPAPLHGQHTREIAAQLLGLSDDEVDAAINSGILEETSLHGTDNA